MSKPKPHNTAVADFEAHLLAKGLAAHTVHNYLLGVGSFLASVGNQPIERITEEQTREYFDSIKNPNNRRQHAMIISRFLTFAATKLPAVLSATGADMAPLARQSEKEIELRKGWAVAKLVEQKGSGEDLIAKLARRVIDHYLYFQNRLKGEPENLDDLVRFADDCRELIESNLALFMSLSAGGRNIHSAIDERVQK